MLSISVAKQFLKPITFFLSLFFLLIPLTTFASSTIDVVYDETVTGSVELTPGYINGSIDLGGQNISRIDLTAQNSDYSAKINPTAEGPFSMTVNVPKGGSADYLLTGLAYMDGYNTRMYFKDRSATVSDGKATTVNLIVNSGYITGTIRTNGCSISKGEIWGVLDDGTHFSRAYTRFDSTETFNLPIQPNQGIKVYGQVQLSGGSTYTLNEQYITVTPGTESPVSWEITCGEGISGAIQNDIDYKMPMDYHYTYLYNQGAWSPYQIERHEGSVRFDPLDPGVFRVYAYSYWNGGHNMIGRYFTQVNVSSGKTTPVTINEQPGFLKGTVTLKGTKTIADVSYAYLYGYGKTADTTSTNMHSRSMIDPGSGSYNLALPKGEWEVYLSYYNFYKPDPSDFLHSTLYMYDYSRRTAKINTEEGISIEGHNLTYETGSATITYSRSDGGAFSAPYIYAKCYNRDETGKVISYIYSHSKGEKNSDRVRFVGFPGTYEVEAWAYVDGSLTTFGKVQVEIVSGVNKVVDIGGPSLTVKTPAPSALTHEDTVTVTGVATDDIGVNQIRINGKMADLTSTQNPDDPNEVFFSIDIALIEGENNIETIATDLSGNHSSDHRTITYEILKPEIIEGLLDIKPGSCKNPLNVTSKGVLPVILFGSNTFDISMVDTKTVQLAGVSPLRSVADDAADADKRWIDVCDTDQSDGFTDLVLKFDTQEIVKAMGNTDDGDVLTLTLTALSTDGTPINAADTVTIIKNSPKRKKKR